MLVGVMLSPPFQHPNRIYDSKTTHFTTGAWFTTEVEHPPECFFREIEYSTRDPVDQQQQIRYTLQYYCNPSTATPDIKESCKDFLKFSEKCWKTDDEIEALIKDGKNRSITEWEPLPQSHVYYKLWGFDNPQIDKGSVSLVPKTFMDKSEELESAKNIMNQVPSNVKVGMESTGT